jgi:hypothetical protein
MGTRIRHALALTVSTILYATTAAGQDLSQDWIIERTETVRPLGDVQSVELRNRFGDIRTRTASDANISIFAVIQHHRDDPERPRLRFRENQRRLLIEVQYPQRESGVPAVVGADKRRIDTAVFVPDKVFLRIETAAGRAETKGHKGTVEVKTGTGKIVIVTHGTVRAFSERGSIQATFKNRQWTGSSRFETITGNITIHLMEHPDVLAEVSTAGDITTDYSVDITSFAGSSRKEAQARIGTANHKLEVRSANGSIKLGRIFDMIPASVDYGVSPSHSPAAPAAMSESLPSRETDTGSDRFKMQ